MICPGFYLLLGRLYKGFVQDSVNLNPDPQLSDEESYKSRVSITFLSRHFLLASKNNLYLAFTFLKSVLSISFLLQILYGPKRPAC